ncbi:B-cell scaffold protein with ankyrin repeats [Seriola lalandi dorsalis]|uniref:B-cell scaffold protein with ankyrin repeats n=1 Tax=Seriola lalandi dorsalis TaxID=1841481 RepID=UPI000C6F915C|nr:B-cell scaffold protein with ankyrin repeats [Seriola lalandi dorsalis]XP_056224390.1 B-cell scaffold protein with ankyrin repeats-like isoform X3 [Seriola aureovittata]
MSQTAEELLIIYETEAEQWATYLKTVFTGPISEAGICCYDIATVSSRRDDFLRLAQYNCKLLILSKGMLEGLCQMWRFFLARVLSPAANVVVLLCGVESLTPLLERVPLNGDECLVISSEQDAHVYLSTVTDIVKKGGSTTAANVNPLTCNLSGSEQKAEQMQSTGAHSVRCRAVVVPSRVPCGTSMDVFILLKNEASGSDAEVEFTAENQMLRLKPVHWNDQILCVKAPDFPAGNVRVTVYSDGAPLSMAQLQYYSSMEEISCLLSRVADPVDFMCQALQVSSVDKLDEKLSSMLLEGMPTGGFQALQCENTPDREIHPADVPSLLHFAAQYGFKSVSSLLLQCPGAERALHTANRHGQTPTEIAKSHGHTELHTLLKETLNMLNPDEDNGDASVYEVMCTAGNPSTTDVQQEQQGGDEGEEVEDLYAPLGVNDEYDTILNSTKAVFIANRPPAPTPRPESTQVKEDKTPYIAQVFQKKKTPQGEADLYSLPTKQARGREDSISSTYDTFVPNQIDGLQQLIELQQRVKAGSLTVDEALERFSDWQRVQKGMDAIQQEKLSQLRASIINNREDDDSVYDKINIVHHTPNHFPPGVAVNESRRGSQPVESDFYSKPLKGQHSNFFWRADKR